MKSRKIFGDALVSSLRITLAILRGIILIPIITNLLGEEAYGIWVVYIAIINMVASVGGFHFYGALIRYTPQEDHEGQTLVDTLSLAIGSAAVFGLILLGLEIFIGVIPGVNGGDAVPAVILLLCSKIVLSVAKNYPRALNQVKVYEAVETVQLLLETILLSIIFWQFGSLIAGLWTLVAVTIGLNVALCLFYLPRDLRTPDISSFGRYLRYSAPMVPKSMGTQILGNADRYLINLLISPTAVAVYAVSYSVARMIQNITTPLNSTLYPAVSKAWEESDFGSVERLYQQIFRTYTLIGIPAVVGISILAGPILTLISTEQIASNGQYLLPVLAFGFFVRGYDNPLAYVFNAAEKNIILAKTLIGAAAGNVILNIVLIPIYEVFGAVVATIVSQGIIFIYLYVRVQEILDIGLPVRTVGWSLVASLLMAAILIYQPITLSRQIKLIVYPFEGVVIYGLIIVASGQVTVNQLKIVTGNITEYF